MEIGLFESPAGEACTSKEGRNAMLSKHKESPIAWGVMLASALLPGLAFVSWHKEGSKPTRPPQGLVIAEAWWAGRLVL